MACGQLEFVGVKQDYLQMHKPQNLKHKVDERADGHETKAETRKTIFTQFSREENCPDRRQRLQNKCEQSQKVDKGSSSNKNNNITRTQAQRDQQ